MTATTGNPRGSEQPALAVEGRGRVWLSDLLVAHALGRDALEVAFVSAEVDLSGWRRSGFAREEAPPTASPTPTRAWTADAPREPERRSYFRVTQLEELKPASKPRVDEPAPPPSVPTAELSAPPRPAELAPWSRLLPFAESVLRSSRFSGTLDVPPLVRTASRLRPLSRLPKRRRLGWADRATLLVQTHPRLIPISSDQTEFVRRVLAVRGEAGLDLFGWRHDPEESHVVWMLDQLPPEGHLLVLGDLGHYGGIAARRAWERAGRRLREEGHHLSALIAVPRSRWDDHVTSVWNAQPWEVETVERGRVSPKERQRRVATLLTLLSSAVRLEPGLVRAVRLLLGRDAADIGTEIDAWNDPSIVGWSAAAATLDPETAKRRRRALGRSRRVDADDRQDEADAAVSSPLIEGAVQKLREWREHLPAGIRSEEFLELDSLDAPGVRESDVELATAYFKEAAWKVQHGSWSEEELAAKRAHFRRLVSRVNDSFWGSDEIHDAIAILVNDMNRHEEEPIYPPGFGPREEAAAQGGEPPDSRTIEVWQAGNRLEFHPRAPGRRPMAGEAEVGSWVGTLTLAHPRVSVSAKGSVATGRDLDAKELVTVDLPPGREVVVESDLQRLLLTADPRPAWATSFGQDEHGSWAEVEVEGVTLRMRWIPPGRFLQGSPESEEGRYSDEGPQREVVWTRGFWLAETATTQALWEGVMGSNPSRFKSPDRPVERVSWEDAQEFIVRLREMLPDFAGRLPSEAEWEYACRGGTTSSTYVGELTIVGERNAPLLDPIAWYGGNSGVAFDLEEGEDSSGWDEKQYEHQKGGTRRVGQKLPNSLGLYDMLGNVAEWCEDGWDGNKGYTAGKVKDPGPAGHEGAKRVCRGGSWFDRARYVRAAFRSGDLPGARGEGLGFRLAEGPMPSGEAK